ncbi:Ubiquitin thioesterase otulin [Mizuhopecten yessoensis]|uniref:Ubiquitin thioesterase otulin n=1 Tax=Mizuhopecten yessoensis TaxID=6573 RepID=A0A210R1N6_MIZYE|nr:Ubiquitin thioesterase otulin [Mizuhopecten yessoensis]
MSHVCLYSLHGAVIRRGVNSPGVSLASAESLADLCCEFQHVVNSVIDGEKRLIAVIQFPFRGSVVRIDLSDPKTTSLLCAVSLGFGISTYILYRLYCRYIQPFFRKPPDGKSETTTSNKSTETNHDEEGSGMGNTGSNDESPPIRYNAREDVVVGLPERSPNIPMSPTKPRQRRRKQRKTINADKARPRRPRPRDGVSVSSDEGDNQLNISHDASDWETGSLKGNLSIKSLSERNVKYGFGNEKHCETNSEQKKVTDDPTEVEVMVDKENVDGTVQQREITVSDHSGHGVVDCSVLLTPPSEEEALAYANITNLRGLTHSTTPTSSTETDRSVLENYVSFGPLSSSGAMSGVMSSSGAMSISDQDEDKDVSAPNANTKILSNTGTTYNDNNKLHNQTLQQQMTGTLDNVPPLIATTDNHSRTTTDELIHNTPEKITRTSSSGDDTSNSSSPFKSASSHVHGQSSSSGNMSVDDEGTTDSLSSLSNRKFDKGFQQSLLHRLHEYSTGGSNSTSYETSPDISPYHRASSGVSSRQGSLSDLATSDSEIFNMDGSSSLAEQEFSKIEGEIGHLDEEFVSLNTKLVELMSKSATASSGNSAILPSLCVDIESNSIPASPVRKQNDALLSNKKLKHCVSGNSSQSHSDSSFSPQHLQSDGVDLSWEYYDMDPENLPGDSQFKEEAEHDLGNIVVQKEESSDGISAAGEDNGHTTCDDLEMDSCNDGTGENNYPKNDQSTTGSVQIGNKVNIVDYAEREWKGETDKASTIKQAYTEVVKMIPCQNLQPIRGDNYCGIRGCVFQCLSNMLSPRCAWRSLDHTLSLLHATYTDPASSLHCWTFASRLTPQEPLSQMQACLTYLFSKFEDAEQMSAYEERRLWATSLLNSDPAGDVMLMEGVKLLMLLEAVRLYNRSQTGADVPLFVWLMFARDTSDTPAKFVTNHLNCVGDTAGLEQVGLQGRTLTWVTVTEWGFLTLSWS